jgi:phytoene dehydrogenase-like protein
MTGTGIETADAVVIGAGHNGLVAANVLADAGWTVTVIEEQPHPGGACRHSRELDHRFVTDLFSSFYPLGAVSPVFSDLGLTRIGLEWVRSPTAVCHVLADGRTVSLHSNPHDTAADLEAINAGDGARWLAAYAHWRRVSSPFVHALLDPFPPVRAGLGLARELGPSGLTAFARLALLDAWQMSHELFAGDGARSLLLGNAMHADTTLTSPGSGVLGWLLCMLGQQVGFPVPRGGSGKIVDALVGRLEARGGRLVLGDAVSEVIVRDGQARGVVCQSGRSMTAQRAVLANVPATSLYGGLVSARDLPAGFASRFQESFVWDHATVKVNWALGAKIPWREVGPRSAGTVHLGGDPVDMADAAHALTTGRSPRTPFVLFGQTAVADQSRAPDGAESAWAYTHIPRALADDSSTVSRAVAAMEDAVEGQAPGFRDRILARSVQSPRDLQGSDSALSLGALNGGTAALHQMLVLRPFAGMARPETPVDRLYLTGCSAHPGGGVHGACGRNAATAALRRSSVLGRPSSSAWSWLARRTAARELKDRSGDLDRSVVQRST